jgi:hypothetical protein
MRAGVDAVLKKLGVETRRRAGRLWAERCPHPDHGRQNPAHDWQNFFVRPDGRRGAGSFYCYSCKQGGRLFELVMALAKLDAEGAVAWLRDVDDAPAAAPVVAIRYRALGARDRFSLPDGVEFSPLGEWNSVPRAYAESRGIDAGQVARWGIGVAFEGRLAGRIVFPIRDSSRRLANYAARTFVDDETRYLAASEVEEPDLSAMLGEEFWPATVGASTVVVFEGAVSGMALERAALAAGAGVLFAGLQGSRVDARRVAKLARFGRVIAATDPDDPGDCVAEEIRVPLSRRGIPVDRFPYPERGVDAADSRTSPEVLAEIFRSLLEPRRGIVGA